jgi:hypothetical protein
MEITNQNENSALEPTPRGFTVIPLGKDALIIHHKRTGMGCMNIFTIVWLPVWGIWCVVLLQRYLNGGRLGNVDPIPLWLVLLVWVGELVVAYHFTYWLFCKQSFRIEAACLTMETDVLGFAQRANIPKGSIKRIVQVKDGGEGDDSFASWGLKVEGDRVTTLIYRQPYEKSHWLGRVLAKWAQVDFVEALRE